MPNQQQQTLTIPNDPMILFSFVNMKLRDFYTSLDEMCEDMGISKEEISTRLEEAGFEYNAIQNKFW